MGLTPGSRFGPYEIRSPLGAGGMGEVYRATDTTLDRDVAIKVLPEGHAHDPERLARFQREAKTLAALNHPHIAHIFGLERIGGVSALVLELVEGPTLADQIAGTGLSVDEALRLAHQIAEALEAAHAQDIVHRDLKPANIKVTPDGTVKVLDFGLAKIIGPPQGGPQAGARSADGGALAGLSLSPTITTPAMTGIGVILGTAAYMSPEQAKGREADERSDVWAFGCVLFEMLTGTRAFDGDDVSDTLASVLKSEPNWSRLPADLPLAIRTLLQRCLVKDRRARVSGIAVAKFVLAEASALVAPRPTQIVTTHDAPAEAGHDGLKRALLVAGALLLAAVTGLAAWWLKPAAPSPQVAFSVALPDRQQLSSTGRQMVAISPDGSQVVYVGVESISQGVPAGVGQRLYIRSLSEFESHPIPGSELSGGLGSPVFSPDGRSIAFYSPDGLKRIPVTGGTALPICPADNPHGVTWDESGIIFGQTRGVFRCPANGGTPEQLVSIEQGERVHGPQLLPDGQTLLFTLAKITDLNERWDKGQIVAQSLTSKTRTTIINGASDARYLHPGHLLYAVGGTLFAAPFDPVRLALTGGSVGVIEGVRRASNAQTGAAQLSISNNGTLVYVPGPSGLAATDRLLALADRSGAVTKLKLPPRPYVHVRAARTGSRIVFDTDSGRELVVWTHDLSATSEPIRLTFAGKNGFPIISPDGEQVAYQSDRDGDMAIFIQRADGSGQAERMTKPEKGDQHVPESWSPDGRQISFSVITGATSSLWTLSLADRKTTQFADGQLPSSEPIGSVFSPDGHWIAYHSARRSPGDGPSPANTGVFVQPVPANGTFHQAPKINIDFHPLWSPDGKELIYVPLAASGQLAAVSVTPQTIVPFGSPKLLPAVVTMARTSGLTRSFDILPDGRFIGAVQMSDENEANNAASTREMRVVLNWLDELNRLVPVK